MSYFVVGGTRAARVVPPEEVEAIELLAAQTGAALLNAERFERLAELDRLKQDFVSTVSHELRTPLTVIRTAAFNLRGKLASRPEQVERYGKLIQEECEKLAATVEQVLRGYDHLTPEDVQACLAYASDVLKSERVYLLPNA